MRPVCLGLVCICWALSGAGQTYTHPTTGIAGEYVGACETATCSGTYTDNGGAAGNYSNNINATYRVFCPNTPGQCVRLTFTSFSMEPMVDPAGPLPLDCYYDYLTVGNGATQNSPVIDQPPSSGVTATGRICGAPAVPFTYTATNSSGCLSVRMSSDFSINGSGWTATLSCVPCAGGPTGLTNNDCINATLLCANTAVPANSSGPGIVAEACGGGGCPAGGENYSNWYVITIQTGGTLNFTITPTVATDDYDYAIYGPNVSCGSLGPSIRCSDSGVTGNTGLSAAAVDVSESVTGDGYTAQMNVLTGEVYYIMIDEWTPTGAGYNLSFGGTAVLGCTLAPVEWLSFDARYDFADKVVNLEWITVSELNNDYFAVERSLDGEVFETIDVVQGSGTTQEQHVYFSTDRHPMPGMINYYRLRQVDDNGHHEFSEWRAVMIIDPDAQFYVAPNPANAQTTFTYISPEREEEVIIHIYNAMGQIVSSQRHVAYTGVNHYPYLLESLPRGVYFVTLETRGQKFRLSLIREE